MRSYLSTCFKPLFGLFSFFISLQVAPPVLHTVQAQAPTDLPEARVDAAAPETAAMEPITEPVIVKAAEPIVEVRVPPSDNDTPETPTDSETGAMEPESDLSSKETSPEVEIAEPIELKAESQAMAVTENVCETEAISKTEREESPEPKVVVMQDTKIQDESRDNVDMSEAVSTDSHSVICSETPTMLTRDETPPVVETPKIPTELVPTPPQVKTPPIVEPVVEAKTEAGNKEIKEKSEEISKEPTTAATGTTDIPEGVEDDESKFNLCDLLAVLTFSNKL